MDLQNLQIQLNESKEALDILSKELESDRKDLALMVDEGTDREAYDLKKANIENKQSLWNLTKANISECEKILSQSNSDKEAQTLPTPNPQTSVQIQQVQDQLARFEARLDRRQRELELKITNYMHKIDQAKGIAKLDLDHLQEKITQKEKELNSLLADLT